MKISDKLVTVLTPTYNRGDLLINAYKSLIKQDNKNFVWMVIDDGSVDNTEEIIKRFIDEKKIDIVYLKKDNGGKHTALNYGIEQISTELTVILDSDDKLLSNAVSNIELYYEKYKNYDNVGILCFLRCHSNGIPIVNLDNKEFVSNYIDYRIRHNHPGDMAEVFFTEVLKKYPFPVFKNEKFISEDVVWIQMGLDFDTVFIGKSIYVCDYLSGGLTDSDKKVKFQSPVGSMLRGNRLMNKQCGIRANIRGAIIYNCYKIEANRKKINYKVLICCNRPILCFVLYPVGIFFNIKWRKEI